ncbi:MAG TPA: hypothetical protein IAB05_01555, partial [Candidatus Stercoripulliclostridium merdigallinarum]|nr:hypothetical protein [Candidatus Stercoripulliclostridium merdigallinarum]
MKYKIFDYGVPGRKPFVENYEGSSATGPKIDADCYPKRPLVCLNSLPDSPNGACVAGKAGSVWLLKYSVFKNGKWAEAEALSEPDYSAASKDGRFRYLMSHGVAVTFVKYDISSFAVSLTALEKLKIRLEFMPLFPDYAEMKLQMNTVIASAPEHAVIIGTERRAENFIIHEGRYDVTFDNKARREWAALTVFGSRSKGTYDIGMDKVIYEVALNKGSSKLTAFVRVGTEDSVKEVPSEEELIRGIGNAELEYTALKAVGTGNLAGKIGEIYSGIYSHRAYDALRMGISYYPDKNAADAALTAE